MIQSYPVSKMNDLKLNLYSIQEIIVDSPEHQIFKILQKSSFQLFPMILAVKQSDNNLSRIQLLSLDDLKPFQIQTFWEDSLKLKICFSTLKALWYLHQIEYFTGPKLLQQFIFWDRNSFNIKMNPYSAKPIEGYKFEEHKKDKNIAKNGIQLCFDLSRNPKSLDVWKWASFTAKAIFNFSVQNYIDKVFSTEKIKEYQAEIVKKTQFVGVDELRQMLSLCLKVDPKQRPSIQQIMPLFHKIIANIDLHQNPRVLMKIKQQYIQQEKQIKPLMELQIKDDILLTDDLKKKVCNQFIKNAMKPPKQFKPLFRATRFQFSSRVFYQMCSKNSKLLFIIDALESGIICSYIEPEINIDDKQGLSGNYISDPSARSFIYSVKNQETYKLIFKEKAFKCVPGRGPIIGDGDLILGNCASNNQCNFPKSYQSGKNKKLTAKTQFSIKNYDVYTLTF